MPETGVQAERRSTGACLCGEVTFEVKLPTRWCAHCHCTMCQRAHGAALVTWVGVELDQFSLQGTDELVNWYQSSADSSRGFCKRCGTTLFFRSARWPDEIHVVRTAFSSPIDREPAAHAYYDSHVSWLAITDDLQKVDDPKTG